MSSELAEVLTRARQSGDPDGLVQWVPYARFIGVHAQLIDGELIATMSYRDQLIGNPALPALHGGTVGSLLESAAVFELLWSRETVLLPRIINITVDYLRSGKPVATHARGVVTRSGRRIANVRAEAWQDDRARPIATAQAHFLLVAPDE